MMAIMDEVEDMLERIITLGMKTKEYPYLISIPGIQKCFCYSNCGPLINQLLVEIGATIFI